MNETIRPGIRTGKVRIPASKSQAHRLLICAALGEGETEIACRGISKDIAATIRCLNALGAQITEDGAVLRVKPITAVPTGERELLCGESGSTLRFMLPVVGVLGAQAVFCMEGRLPLRPLEPFRGVLCAHGMTIRQDEELLYCGGKLQSGAYTLPGNISSQYISGLLMALPHVDGDSALRITGRIESAAYITMTEDALREGDIDFEKRGKCYRIPGAQRGKYAEKLAVEGDFSNAAFFLCMGALSRGGIEVSGLKLSSSQGDRAVLAILKEMGANVTEHADCVTVSRGALRGCTIDAAPIPDLIPVLSVLASVAEGETKVVNAARLRLKESDRLQTTAQLLTALGAQVEELPEGLVIRGKQRLSGGTVDACGDHRIAMSAAVAACACTDAVTVCGSECVQKSYPEFWNDFAALKEENL